MFKRLSIVALTLGLSICAAAAFWQSRDSNYNLLVGASAFLPNCQGTFAPQNFSKNSNDFTTGWTASNSGSTSPTITTVTDTLPDSTSGTVDKVVFGAVSAGTTNFSVLSWADTNSLGNYPITHSVWAKVVAGAGTDYISVSHGTTFTTAAITNDGAWHQITASAPIIGNFNQTIQIGINQFDTGQRGGTVSTTIELTGDYFIASQYNRIITYATVKTGGPLATTGTEPLQAAVTAPCPAHVALRDPSLFVPYPGNPIISESPTEIWASDGVSNAYIQAQFQSGGFYYAWSNCASSSSHSWLTYCLFKSTDGLAWTEVTTNAPYLQTFGSILAKPTIVGGGSGFTAGTGTATWLGSGCGVTPVIAPTVASTTVSSVTPSPNNGIGTGVCPHAGWPTGSNTNWTYTGVGGGSGASYSFAALNGTGSGAAFWQLHPAFLPGGCYDPTNAASRTFCVLYSAQNTSVLQNIYLAWATTVDGVYTPIGCVGPGVCTGATPVTFVSKPPSFSGNPGLVTVYNDGTTTYVYANSGGNPTAGTQMLLFTTPTSNAITTSGNTLTYVNSSTFTVASGIDWYSPNASTNILDPFIFKNHCGFYEMYYTVLNVTSPGAPFTNGKEQLIGESVSDSPVGPWWQYPAATIPTNSSLYNSAIFVGDQAAIELSGQFILTMNYDTGAQSRAVAITAPEGSCP